MFHTFYKHSKNFISSYAMPAYCKEVDTGKNCMYPSVQSLYKTVISIYIVLYDPNGVVVMTQTGQLYMYIATSVSLIGMPTYPSTRQHKQVIKFIKFFFKLEISNFSYLIYMDNYNHIYSYEILTNHYFVILVR